MEDSRSVRELLRKTLTWVLQRVQNIFGDIK